jgi:hypothetical protein
MGMNGAGIGLVFASMFLTAYFMPNYWIHFAFTAVLRNVIRKKIAAGEVAVSDTTASSEPTVRRRPAAPQYGPRKALS